MLAFSGRIEYMTPARHSVSGFDLNFDVGGFENEEDTESNVNLIQEFSANSSEIGLFSKLKPVLNEPEDGGSYSEEDGLEFAELQRRSGHASSSLDSGDLEVGKEFSTKDGFVAAVK
ncbi:hypothetical protein PVK06_006951 [Gossypium arboreum]|uniref:Uncharacterized protein n=1 Tax=Gossypium arboreum TaxID=29729 RepID=A0ABR0QFY5_GOSAR|nr:hypothetical protein PVK06_006951 [Gossypium arboreum]